MKKLTSVVFLLLSFLDGRAFAQPFVPAIPAQAAQPGFVFHPTSLSADGCAPDPASGKFAIPVIQIYRDEQVRFVDKVCLRINVQTTAGVQQLFTVFTNSIFNRGDTLEISAFPPNGGERFTMVVPNNINFFLPITAAFGRDNWTIFGDHSYASTVPPGTSVTFSADYRPNNMIPTQFINLQSVLGVLQTAEGSRDAADAQRNSMAPIDPSDQAH